jgi:hypothetical protein
LHAKAERAIIIFVRSARHIHCLSVPGRPSILPKTRKAVIRAR